MMIKNLSQNGLCLWHSPDCSGLCFSAAGAILLAAALSLLAGGCQPSDEEASKAEAQKADAGFKSLTAMHDKNVTDLSFEIVYFYAKHKRLPAKLEEISPNPAATVQGLPITYRATGERTFELIVATDAGAQDSPIVIPLDIPTDMPATMSKTSLRVWWDLEYDKVRLEKLQKGLGDLLKAPS
jgi:hypothetical protein